MNGRMAKKIRKALYGDQVTSAKGRKYFADSRQIVSDKIRQLYQKIKRDYIRRIEHGDKEERKN